MKQTPLPASGLLTKLGRLMAAQPLLHLPNLGIRRLSIDEILWEWCYEHRNHRHQALFAIGEPRPSAADACGIPHPTRNQTDSESRGGGQGLCAGRPSRT